MEQADCATRGVTSFKLVETELFTVLAPVHAGLPKPTACIVFSAHGDTCFGESSCLHVPDSNGGLLFGHVDNAAGVFAMMKAYFSGKLPPKNVQCQVTYGEEKTINGVHFAGARDVMTSLQPHDFVAVIDVTGSCPRPVNQDTIRNAGKVKGHVVIEKIRNNQKVLDLLACLRGRRTHMSGTPVGECDGSDDEDVPYTYETYNFCNDPQAFIDETDAYRETQTNTVFLGLPTRGGSAGHLSSDGDYNAGPVFCWQNDIDALSLLIIDIANAFVSPAYQQQYNKEKS
jgi:hypothetical protein